MPGRERFPEFEVMRGLAIAFVVYLHVYFDPWETTPDRYVAASRVLDLFAHTAVPVFFFLSAFLLAKDSSATFGEFASKKVRRIGVPLAFWVLAVVAYRIWQAEGATEGLARSALLLDVSGHFFFLGVLAMFTAVSWFLRGWSARRLAVAAVVAFILNLATMAYYESSVVTGDFAIFAYRNPLTWVFFFTFGLWAGRRFETLDWTRRVTAPAMAVMTAAAAAYFVMGERYGHWPVSYFGTTLFLFSAASLVAYSGLLVRAQGWQPMAVALVPFERLGRYAFAIYLVHMPFFVGYVTGRFVSDSRLNDDWWQLITGLYVVGLFSALAFVLMVERVAPAFAAEFLGIARRERLSRAEGTKERVTTFSY